MLIDEAEIVVKGGHGGAGKVSFFPPPMRGPDGGNGGKGGDIYIVATSDLMALRPFTTRRLVEGENGGLGGGNRKFGKDGKEREILMPVGTNIKDTETGEEFNLTTSGQRILICAGGLGGRGNYEFKSSTRTTPKFAQPGLPGEVKGLQITLKLIADFGLIGLPNAGKSSLLNELTLANAKTADYPFTTLEPNLGVLDGKILADVPGLIEGASEGKGLGTRFLKHIEKVGKLLHCVSAETPDVIHAYKTVRNELEKHNPMLVEKDEIILLTKSDLIEEKDLKEKLKILKKLNHNIIPVSIHNYDQMEQLKAKLLVTFI